MAGFEGQQIADFEGVWLAAHTFVELDTNRYSVPTDYRMAANIFAYPDHVETPKRPTARRSPAI